MTHNLRINSIEAATGRSWGNWQNFLKSENANNLGHQEIASIVHKELEGKIDNPGWWAQSVTVAYEQYIGRRMVGQNADGTFQMSVSRATNLQMQALMDEWVQYASSDKTLKEYVPVVAKIRATDKRITWRAKSIDGTNILITSEPKPNGAATIVAAELGLPSHELNLVAKERWASILDRFIAP